MSVSFNEILKSSIKKISKVKFGGGDTDKAVSSLYDKINEMIDSVNRQTGHLRSLAEGKPGDIRVRKREGEEYKNTMYSLEIKTDKGWASVPIELIED